MKPARQFIAWKTTEAAVVREVYPTRGARACAAQIQRTEHAVRQFAYKHGIDRICQDGKPWKRHPKDEG